ncbi:unnamed protein product, partial [Iphiclides podalirius]
MCLKPPSQDGIEREGTSSILPGASARRSAARRGRSAAEGGPRYPAPIQAADLLNPASIRAPACCPH